LVEDRDQPRLGVACEGAERLSLREGDLCRSFLLRRVATLAVSFRALAEKAVPKPSRSEESFEEVATLSWEPPTLAIRGECLVLTTTLRSGTRLRSFWKASVPSVSISPWPTVGSMLPSTTGRVNALPLPLAPAEALRAIPSAFRKETKRLSRVSLVVPEPRGS
jgi:hypothetical protein